MSYRNSPAFRAAVIVAACQKLNMRHRVGTLENTRAPAVAIRKRREVRA